jgi:hypothetical protein
MPILFKIIVGDKKATHTKEKVPKNLRACHNKAKEMKKARSHHLPNPIVLGASLLWKYKAFLEKVKVAVKEKAEEYKHLQDGMNGYKLLLGIQAWAPDNFLLTHTPCTVTHMPTNPCPLETTHVSGMGRTPLDSREETTTNTPVIIHGGGGHAWHHAYGKILQPDSCGGIKESDGMKRLLLSVTSILDGHHKKDKVYLDLQKKISVIYEIESRALACGDIKWVKLLKKRHEVLEEKLLEE